MNEPILLGELILSSTGAPSEALILRKGENQTRKGTLVFDEDAASSVMSEYEKGGVKLPLDFDHAMADSASRVEDRFAAGWFVPAVRDGELIASEIEWTDRGRKAVESKEWRYLSLFGDIEPLGKGKARLRRLRNVALTNLPATLHTLPLVANEGSQGSNPMAEENKTEPRSVLVTLGVKDVSEAVEKITTLTATLSDVAATLGCDARPDTVRGALQALKLKADKADALETEVASMKTARRDALIKTLSEEGKLPPAQHEWAKKQSIESLEEFAKGAPKVTASEPVASNQGQQAPVTLSSEEKSVARLLGLQPADVLAHKTKLADSAA